MPYGRARQKGRDHAAQIADGGHLRRKLGVDPDHLPVQSGGVPQLPEVGRRDAGNGRRSSRRCRAWPRQRPDRKACPAARCGCRPMRAGISPATSSSTAARIEALVDTGATLVAINVSTAKRIGIDLAPADFKYQVETANGNGARCVGDDRQSADRAHLHRKRAGARARRQGARRHLIGMSFLKRLDKFEVADGAAGADAVERFQVAAR